MSSPLKLGKLVSFLDSCLNFHENNLILSGHVFKKYSDGKSDYDRGDTIMAMNNLKQSAEHFREVCKDQGIDADILLGDVEMEIDPDRIPDEPQ